MRKLNQKHKSYHRANQATDDLKNEQTQIKSAFDDLIKLLADYALAKA